jgi:hypothetical protein
MTATRGRRGRPLVAVLAGVALAVSLAPAPAQARPAPVPTNAMNRCQQGTDPDLTTTLHLEGGRGARWPDAAQQLRPGDVVRILPHTQDWVSTTGWWWQPAEGWNWVTPAGVSPRAAAPAGYPAPGLNQQSLVGTLASLPPFEVATRTECQHSPVSGVLDLRINDPQDWDNFGAWDVDVQIYRAPVVDSGFDAGLVSPWFTEGTGSKVVSSGAFGNPGVILSTGEQGWNAVLQTIPVRPFTQYEVNGRFKTPVNTAFFGVRLPGQWPPTETHFGPTPPPDTWLVLRQPFNSGPNTSVTVFAGYWGTGAPTFMIVDDLLVLST